MILYNYDKDGAYIRPTSPQLSPAKPINDDNTPNYIIPKNCTPIEPLKCDEGEVCVFSNGAWSCVVDRRGSVVYNKNTQESFYVTSIGPIPEGFTDLIPPSKSCTFDETNNVWVIDIVMMRNEAEKAIDIKAELVRETFITPGSGQAAAYLKKESEARAVLEDSTPTSEKYPFIAAEVGITGDDLVSVAKVIVSNANLWWLVGASIEKCRLEAKMKINKANTQDEINSIISNISWPKEQ